MVENEPIGRCGVRVTRGFRRGRIEVTNSLSSRLIERIDFQSAVRLRDTGYCSVLDQGIEFERQNIAEAEGIISPRTARDSSTSGDTRVNAGLSVPPARHHRL
jgi:hypothetical protein